MNTTKYGYAIMSSSSMPDMSGRERYVQICERTFRNLLEAEQVLQDYPCSRGKFTCQRVVGEWERVQ